MDLSRRGFLVGLASTALAPSLAGPGGPLLSVTEGTWVAAPILSGTPIVSDNLWHCDWIMGWEPAVLEVWKEHMGFETPERSEG